MSTRLIICPVCNQEIPAGLTCIYDATEAQSYHISCHPKPMKARELDESQPGLRIQRILEGK